MHTLTYLALFYYLIQRLKVNTFEEMKNETSLSFYDRAKRLYMTEQNIVNASDYNNFVPNNT